MDRPDPQATCAAPDGLTVLYDGACPLCRREIGLYQDLKPTQPLEFRDISDPSAALLALVGTPRSAARHGVADGDRLPGVPAGAADDAALGGEAGMTGFPARMSAGRKQRCRI